MIKLDIPYLSQHENKVSNGGSLACVAMAAGVGLDAVLARLGRPGAERNKPVLFADLIRILRSYGINSEYKRPLYLPQIKSYLAEGMPVILLANIEQAVEKPGPFSTGQFILAVGYNNIGLYVHNSSWTGNVGTYLWLPDALVDTAMRQPGWGNIPFQGLLIQQAYPFLAGTEPSLPRTVRPPERWRGCWPT